MPDSMEPDWQHVKQEAAHKFPSVGRHVLVAGAALLAVVLPGEGHASLIKGKQALVGDRDAMCIA